MNAAGNPDWQACRINTATRLVAREQRVVGWVIQEARGMNAAGNPNWQAETQANMSC
ncbi:MAG: hypothetical protein OJF49_001855 [Ktedonobacterales bacterium]|nr:MAG: hypothetical protein OJF49_001855 [Ktedonobacterales bacterium]